MPEPVVTKRCSKCKQNKALSEFHKKTDSKDGHQRYCKECNAIYGQSVQKKYRTTEKGKAAIRKYQVSSKHKNCQKRYHQTQKYKQKKRQYQQIDKTKACNLKRTRVYRIAHPEVCKAQDVIKHAIRAGKIAHAREFICNVCAKQARQYHHHKGYKPEHWFDVVPVCVKCHHTIHGI